MSMSTGKRLVADPLMSIGDIMKAFQNFLDTENDLDLLEKVSCPGHVQWSWKTAPHPAWMFKVHGLVLHLVKVAPNLVLQSSKVKSSVQKLCSWKRINRSRYVDCDFSDHIDQRLRIVLAQFRLSKQKSEEYHKAMRKATPEERVAVDEVLSHMVLEHPPTTATNAECSIVPYRQHAPAPKSNASGSSSLALVCASPRRNMYKRVLAKQDSSPLEVRKSPVGKFTKNFAQSYANNRSSSGSGLFVPPEDTSGSATSSPPKRKKKKKSKKECDSSESGAAATPEQKKRTQSVAAATPKQKKSTESVAAATPKQKKQTKAVSSPELDLGEEEQQILKDALTAEIPREKPRTSRRTKKKAPQEKKKKEETKKKASSGLGGKKGGKKDEEEEPVRKSSWRKRKTSSAYHAAMKQAAREGKSPATCKTLARAAHAKMASDIDSGAVKENH